LPRAFGDYELQTEIGRGGMGVIYGAYQAALNRTVAVKLLLSGVHSSEAALQRFQLEAAAAAGLQHPDIVAIHDYGECEGQPYYAMDLVAGRNLAELCDGRPLVARRAAEILRLVAGAVHYAHQRGILHRDLKPSNVLVDEEGRPRVTDFGLAKMLGSTGGGTVTGQMIGSPSYAAPEQAAGRFGEIRVATDVYGLGALFYHLLTGRAPFNAATPTETLRLVLDTDPPPPRLLNPSLPRDLETICLKCLAKEPARRYATAAEVAEDVERFLNERPIRARPPGALYRMGKFARRHRAVGAAIGVAVVALVAGLAMALAGYRRAVVQRHVADAARGQAEQLIGLMTQDLKPALEQRGGLPQLVQMSESAVRYYETLPPELRTTKTDRGHANALAALARLRGLSLDDRKGAEAALRAALVLREKIAREKPDDPEAAAEWLWDEWEFPLVIGDSVTTRSDTRQEKSVDRWQALLARFPDNLRVKQGLAEVLSQYAQRISFDKPKEAVAAATQCRTLVEELVAARPQDKTLGDLIEKSLQALATALQGSGETIQAVAVSEQALTYCTNALRTDPGNLKLREQTAEAARSVCYRAFGINPARGLAAERIAREHYRTLVELNPDDQEYRFRYAVTHMMECYYVLQVDGGFAATRKAFRGILTLLEPFLERKAYAYALELWTFSHLYLAAVAAQAGEPGEARREIERAKTRFADWQRESAEGSVDHGLVHLKFLTLEHGVLLWLRDGPEAARVARECLAEAESGLKLAPANTDLQLRRAVANAGLGIVAQREGKFADAIALLPPAIELMATPPRAHTVYELAAYLAFARVALVEALARSGDTAKARALAESLLPGAGRAEPRYWPDREWAARVEVLLAGLLGPEDAARRLELLAAAETILTAPEAEGRITVLGRETLATIARLRFANEPLSP
jgi:tetratricopeptide (TPR) repeat protein